MTKIKNKKYKMLPASSFEVWLTFSVLINPKRECPPKWQTQVPQNNRLYLSNRTVLAAVIKEPRRKEIKRRDFILEVFGSERVRVESWARCSHFNPKQDLPLYFLFNDLRDTDNFVLWIPAKSEINWLLIWSTNCPKCVWWGQGQCSVKANMPILTNQSYFFAFLVYLNDLKMTEIS